MLEYHPDPRAQFGEIGLFIVDGGAVDDDLTLLDGLQAVDGFNQR